MSVNDTFNTKGEKARFIYKKNPLTDLSYQIFEFKAKKGQYEPVGDYIVLDTDEDTALSDRKVHNLMCLLNGKETEDLGHLTQARTLFNVAPEEQGLADMKRVIFRSYDGTGVSEENALFSMQKEVYGE